MQKLFTFMFALLTVLTMTAQQPKGKTPIDSVQFVPKSDLVRGVDSTKYFKLGDSVTVEGVVTFKPTLYAFSLNRKAAWIQDKNTPFSGVQIMVDFNRLKSLRPNSIPSGVTDLTSLITYLKFYDNFIPGKTVKVTCIVDDFAGETQLLVLPIETEITKLTSTPVKPIVLEIDSFEKVNAGGTQDIQVRSGEPYEGMYVEFKNVSVSGNVTSGNRTTWFIQDVRGNKMQIKDISQWFRDQQQARDTVALNGYKPSIFIPSNGTILKYIRGIISPNGSSGSASTDYRFFPIDTTDIGPATASLPVFSKIYRRPTMATSTDKVDVYATITDQSGPISSAQLKYTVGATSSTVSMSKVDATNNIWKGTIPAQTNLSVVSFKLYAVNGKGLDDSTKIASKYLVKNGKVKSIKDLHYSFTPFGASGYTNDTLKGMSINGRIVSKFLDGAFLRISVQEGRAPYEGIWMSGSANYGIMMNAKVGDSINITAGVIKERSKVTNIDSPTFSVLTSSNKAYPVVSDTGVLKPIIRGVGNSIGAQKLNQYQGMLLEFKKVIVSSNTPDATNFGEWIINDSNYSTLKTAGIRVDDLADEISATYNVDTLTAGKSVFRRIAGVLFGANSNYKIEPRGKADLDLRVALEEAQKSVNILKVYPNPTQNQINIIQPNAGTVSIFDLQGRKVYEQSTSAGLNVLTLNLPNGMYSVVFTDKLSVKSTKLTIIQ